MNKLRKQIRNLDRRASRECLDICKKEYELAKLYLQKYEETHIEEFLNLSKICERTTKMYWELYETYNELASIE